MFDLLKEKLSSFTDKLKKKAEKKAVKQEKGLTAHAPEPRESSFVLPESKPVKELKVSRESQPVPEPKPLSALGQEPEKDFKLREYIRGVKESLDKKSAPEKVSTNELTKSIQESIKEEKFGSGNALEQPPKAMPAKPVQPPKPEPLPQSHALGLAGQEKGTETPQQSDQSREKKPVETGNLKPDALSEKPIKPTPRAESSEDKFELKPMSELMKTVRLEEHPSSPLPPKPGFNEPKPTKAELQPVKPVKQTPKELHAKPADKRELKAKVGAIHSIKGVIRGYTELKEGDIADLLFELELALLESDVNHETATAFVSRVKTLLLKERIPRGTQLNEFLKQKIRQVLVELTETKQINVFELADSIKPFKILFLGPNGAGKTTTIAKLTYSFQQVGKKVIWAAADTFRAASIEQLEAHAKKLNVRVVKHDYGADPTAVAFDAVKAAEAEKADVLMIDSAGRQETNHNLLEELKKMERVIKPDLKVFVGEAFAGKNLIEQAKEFDKALNLDGFVLSKIDTDAKGGTALSLLYEIKKPILFIGTGQEYTDLIKFTPEFIIDRIV